MSLCDDCRNLIRKYDVDLIACEGHKFSIRPKTKCKAYLSCDCADKKKIQKNNKIIAEMLAE